jgi:hypothetical protein
MLAIESRDVCSKMVLLAAFAAVCLLNGCTATTTATVASNFHSPDSLYRFQSCDLTASVQVALKQK